eukprot:403337432
MCQKQSQVVTGLIRMENPQGEGNQNQLEKLKSAQCSKLQKFQLNSLLKSNYPQLEIGTSQVQTLTERNIFTPKNKRSVAEFHNQNLLSQSKDKQLIGTDMQQNFPLTSRLSQKSRNQVTVQEYVSLKDSQTFKSQQNQKEIELTMLTFQIGDQSEYGYLPNYKLLNRTLQAFREIIGFKNMLFSPQLQQILKELEKGLFCDESYIPQQMLDNFDFDKYRIKRDYFSNECEGNLQNSTNDRQIGEIKIPYFEVIKKYHEMFQKMQKSTKQLVKERYSKLQDQERKLKELQDKNEQLETQLKQQENDKEESNYQMKKAYTILNKQFTDLTTQHNIMTVKYHDVCEQNEYLIQFKELSKQVDFHMLTIQEKNQEISSLKEIQNDLEIKLSSQKQMFESRFSEYQKAMMLLKQQKEKVEILNNRIYELEYEAGKISVRAAVAFTEFTPRYSKFESEFKQLKIKKPLEKLSWDKISTKDYIDHLLLTVKELQDKNKELAILKTRRKKKTTQNLDTDLDNQVSFTPFRNISPRSESRFAQIAGNSSDRRSFKNNNGGRFTMYKTERSMSLDKQDEKEYTDYINSGSIDNKVSREEDTFD